MLKKKQTHPLVRLAKKAVENYIKNRKIISPSSDLPKEFLGKKAGIFITIEKKGELRGCVGTFLPTKENIAKEVIKNAIASATKDNRFLPISKEELPYLSYTVYILSPPQLIKDLKDLNPKKYGILIKSMDFPSKSALLLPNLRGIDTIEKQIFIACQKGGIDFKREKILIFRFTAQKYQ